MLLPVIKPLGFRHRHRSDPSLEKLPPQPVGRTVGLSFSVAPDVRLPGASNGDLTPWTRQGVLLTNRAPTTAPRRPAAHRGKGWEGVTKQAIRALVARGIPPVSILRGRDARNLRPLLGDFPAIESSHLSPMSADRGFFGSRSFSRADELLERRRAHPVDRRLP